VAANGFSCTCSAVSPTAQYLHKSAYLQYASAVIHHMKSLMPAASLVSSTQQTSASTSTSTSTVHKLPALSYSAVAQSKSCGIFHI